MKRCHFENVGGVRVFIPGCESGANSDGALCSCPKSETKEPEPSRAETVNLIATVDELGKRLRDLERRVIELERKGTTYGG